jgi:hypothetical protein
MAVLDGAPLYATPDDSWNALLLVLNCGGGDAARRLAGDRDSLTTIRDFIKFAPDWKALELAMKAAGYHSDPRPIRDRASGGDHHVAAVVVEYARFLGLFKGVPHGFLSPPPSWPKLYFDDVYDPPTSELVKLVWEFHSKQDSYTEDCLILTGREIPYYEHHDRPTCSDAYPLWPYISSAAGLLGYRRLYQRYAEVYGTPPSDVWPDVTALVVLANKCQSHLDEWRGRIRAWEPPSGPYIPGDYDVEENCRPYWGIEDLHWLFG